MPVVGEEPLLKQADARVADVGPDVPHLGELDTHLFRHWRRAEGAARLEAAAGAGGWDRDAEVGLDVKRATHAAHTPDAGQYDTDDADARRYNTHSGASLHAPHTHTRTHLDQAHPNPPPTHNPPPQHIPPTHQSGFAGFPGHAMGFQNMFAHNNGILDVVRIHRIVIINVDDGGGGMYICGI